jgi:hypothetical protein
MCVWIIGPETRVVLLRVSDLVDNTLERQFSSVRISAVEDELREWGIEVWESTKQCLHKSVLVAFPLSRLNSLELGFNICDLLD